MKTKMKSPNKKEMELIQKTEEKVIDHLIEKYTSTLQAKRTMEKGIIRCEGALSTLEQLMKEYNYEL